MEEKIRILVSVGGYYLSLEAKRACWITKTYTKEDRPSDYYAVLTIRKDHHYYKYHDYTEFIDTASTIQVCQPYRCDQSKNIINKEVGWPSGDSDEDNKR